MVFVFGNQDRPDELRALCQDWNSGYLLHGDMVELQGLAFFCVGGETPGRKTEPWNTALTEDEACRILQNCPKDAVLITHTPPYECADLQRNGAHEGSRAVRAVIDDKQPLLSLCGRIYFAWGSFGTLGRTKVHNLGPGVGWFYI